MGSFKNQWLCVDVYVITIAFIICTLNQPVTHSSELSFPYVQWKFGDFKESDKINGTWISVNLKVLTVTSDLLFEWLRCSFPTWKFFWFLIFLELNFSEIQWSKNQWIQWKPFRENWNDVIKTIKEILKKTFLFRDVLWQSKFNFNNQ